MPPFAPPNIGYALLDAIACGETYDPREYNELVGGGKFPDYNAFPRWEGRRFPTGMSHAAGRYQFEPATWAEQAKKLGLTDFSPLSQDIAAWDLAKTVYHRVTASDLEQDLQRPSPRILLKMASALHSTWTSIGVHTPDRFMGAYAAWMTRHGVE